MNFLKEHWDGLDSKKELGVNHSRAHGNGFLKPWNHDMGNMKTICDALEILKPKVVIELGTFEAMGTKDMAKALQKNGSKVDFYTIDAGEAPVNSLGIKYGVPLETDDDGEHVISLIPWEDFGRKLRGEHFQQIGWGSWSQVLKGRARRLAEDYSPVNLEYVEGFSYDVLPELLKRIGTWDFCFQDTLHAPKEIMKEWVLLEPYAKVGSIIVFDDMQRGFNRGWADWFIENVKGWDTRWAKFGHEPLWAEKVEESAPPKKKPKAKAKTKAKAKPKRKSKSKLKITE